MANKVTRLKKVLIRDASIAAVIAVVCAIGIYIITGMSDDVQNQKQAKQSEYDTARSEHQKFFDQITTLEEVGEAYVTYIRTHNNSFELKRDLATQILKSLRKTNYFLNLDLSVSPPTDIKNPNLQFTGSVGVKYDIKITFTALADFSIYRLIENLQQKMPGIILVKELNFSKSSDMSRNVLLDLIQHRLTPIIKGELQFYWLGLREPTTTDKTTK